MDKKELAYKDWKAGMKSSDIAEKYKISQSTVRSWKKRYWLSETLQQNSENVATNNNNVATDKKRGAPAGNKNAVKTHEYESIFFDTLTDEEKLLWEEIQVDPVTQLEEMVRLMNIRERRLLSDIKTLRAKQDMSITEVAKRELVSNIDSGKKTQEEKYTKVVPTIDKIRELEETLTRLQTAKMKVLDKIAKLRLENEKFDDSKNINIVENMLVSIRKTAESQREDKYDEND